jgi:uncharacterized membrane protein/protein-disulfide isomerase
MINRLILWFSLLGMILVLHLWVQKSRNFDQGCLGLDKPAVVVDLGCQSADLQAASNLLGVSNAAWGYAFYFALALAAFGKIIASAKGARWLHRFSEAAMVPALLYSGYLVYQMAFVAHAFCLLCLSSATLVLILVALHVLLRMRGGFQPVPESARSTEFGWAVAALFTATSLSVALLLFVNRLGTRPLDDGNSGQELQKIVGQTLPLFIDARKLQLIRVCRIDRNAPPLPLAKFIGPDTPYLGQADGVPIVFFFDPNCPHCRAYQPVFLKLVERFKDHARFYILPRMLWEYSELPIAAVHLAARDGRSFEMWKLLLAQRAEGDKGLTFEQIEPLFKQLGLNTTDLKQRLEALRPEVIAEANKTKSARVNGTPSIYVNGQKVLSFNESEQCVSELIDQTLPPLPGKPALESTARETP